MDAVLFDLDGTLLDHETASTRAVRLSLPGSDPELVGRRWTELSEEAVDRYLRGELSFVAQRRLRIVTLAAELGLGTWDDEHADAWLRGFVERYEEAWRAYPDVGPAIDALARSGVRLGVITNGDAEQQRLKVRRLGLDERLPYVLASSEAGVAKPAAEIFRLACDDLDLSPSRVAYVGDRLDVDAIAATAAGLRGIWLDRTNGTDHPEVTRITTLAELPAALD